MKHYLIPLLLSLLFINSAFADDAILRGPYAALALGRAYTNYSSENFYNNDTGHDATWVLGWQAAVGFDIDNYFGVELSYQTANQRTFNNLNNSGWNGIVDEQTLQLQTVVQMPLFWGLFGFGKIGPAYQMIDQHLDGSGDAASRPPITNRVSLWQPAYAVGLQTFFDKDSPFSAAIEYNIIPQNVDRNIPDTELYLLEIMLHF